MNRVESRDGTHIAFERSGAGPSLILVDGALCYRESGPARPLARLLAPRFTVYAYDRRGRSESGDTAPYAVEREVEDIAALIEEAGGSASVYGISSGAALALEAANRGLAIDRLALYEAPFIVDDTRPPIPAGYLEEMKGLILAGRRGDAVRLFMNLVGVPGFFIWLMRFMPAWPKLEAVAHTLVYDITLVADYERGEPLPPTRWSAVTAPTLVLAGGKSPAWMRNANRALAAVIPGARFGILPGQTHLVKPKVLAPVLAEFFAGAGVPAGSPG